MISKEKNRLIARKLRHNFLKLSVSLCVIYIFYFWTNQPSIVIKNNYGTSRNTNTFPLVQNTQEFTIDERRIARHFAIDTLPGLMQRGLIKKYERHHTVTLLHVAGKLWSERSRFFKESLLSEVSIYNKVNGYAIETRVVDHCSYQLYAQISSLEKKEFFD
jgi:hypothetical protein